MEKLIEFIESKQGGKMSVDYKQGIDDCIDLIKDYQAEQLILSGVINWLPFVRENYPEFDKLTREKNCLCLYDDGTEIDFEKENHPIAIMTHFKAKN